MPGRNVVLIGGSGFIGTAVLTALEGEHHQVTVISAPRLTTKSRKAAALLLQAQVEFSVFELAEAMSGAQVVINTAGDPDASSLNKDSLFGANALLPGVVLQAARRAGVSRFVHVSSAVVQNDKAVLDDTEYVRPFSPYSASKVAGEEVLRSDAVGLEVIRYRPPSVHAADRKVTRLISRIARSPLAMVASPGDQPTPQALLPNVGAAVAFLATTGQIPPSVVHHPSEGVSVTSLMTDLGDGRPPRQLPRWLAQALVRGVKLTGRIHRPTAANARRVELLWLGQAQADSWLTQAGWLSSVGPEGWKTLGEGVSRHRS